VSYDILFVPRRPDQSWDEALDEAEGRDVLTVAIGAERLAQWDRIVQALRERVGPVDVLVDEDVCEATHVSGLQVSLFPDEASVTFPYWEQADQEAFHHVVVDVVRMVEHETGLSAWDAQTDEPFDGRVHDAQGLAATRRLEQQASDRSTTDAMEAMVARGETGPDTGPLAVPASSAPAARDAGSVATGPVEPGSAEVELARDRRRALRYIVIGVIVVIAALLLRYRGESSTLSGIAIAIGVADMVIGGLLYRSYRRRLAGAA
jgi:hypothetical protein